MRLLNMCAAICLLSASLFAADNAFIGTWKLNVAKSKFGPGSAINSMTMTFKLDGSNVRRIAEGTDANGKPIMEGGPEGTSIPWDGQEHEVTQPPAPIITVAVKQINSHTLTATLKTNGKVSEQIKSIVSKDGKTLTSTDDLTNEKGEKMHSGQVFERQ
jgi:hypothetical protein